MRQRRRLSVHFSSATDEWSTPAELVAELAHAFGPFDLDPAATAENAKAPRYFTRADDGLAHPWTGRVFLNPPYGRAVGAWLAKAAAAAREGTAELVVCLVPARTDTAWWHTAIAEGAEIEYLRGRVRFGGADSAAPFPSALLVFRRDERATKSALERLAA